MNNVAIVTLHNIHRIKYIKNVLGAVDNASLENYHVPLVFLPRMKAAMISADSCLLPRSSKSKADKPRSFLIDGSAPASSSNFVADAVPYIEAIIKGVDPLGDAASI
jgi:hypothetical protein